MWGQGKCQIDGETTQTDEESGEERGESAKFFIVIPRLSSVNEATIVLPLNHDSPSSKQQQQRSTGCFLEYESPKQKKGDGFQHDDFQR